MSPGYCRCWEHRCPVVLCPACYACSLRADSRTTRRFNYCGPQAGSVVPISHMLLTCGNPRKIWEMSLARAYRPCRHTVKEVFFDPHDIKRAPTSSLKKESTHMLPVSSPDSYGCIASTAPPF